MHLELHDDEAVARVDPVHASVERSDTKRVEGAPPGFDHPWGRDGWGRGPSVSPVNTEIFPRRVLEHGVGQLAVDEDERPLPARPDVLEKGL